MAYSQSFINLQLIETEIMTLSQPIPAKKKAVFYLVEFNSNTKALCDTRSSIIMYSSHAQVNVSNSEKISKADAMNLDRSSEW